MDNKHVSKLNFVAPFIPIRGADAGYPAPCCSKCDEPLLVPGQHDVNEVQCVNECEQSENL